MNRFQHAESFGITQQRQATALKPVNFRIRGKNKKPKGVDNVAMNKLHARQQAFDKMDSKTQAAHTRPGSMNRRRPK